MNIFKEILKEVLLKLIKMPFSFRRRKMIKMKKQKKKVKEVYLASLKEQEYYHQTWKKILV